MKRSIIGLFLNLVILSMVAMATFIPSPAEIRSFWNYKAQELLVSKNGKQPQLSEQRAKKFSENISMNQTDGFEKEDCPLSEPDQMEQHDLYNCLSSIAVEVLDYDVSNKSRRASEEEIFLDPEIELARVLLLKICSDIWAFDKSGPTLDGLDVCSKISSGLAY